MSRSLSYAPIVEFPLCFSRAYRGTAIVWLLQALIKVADGSLRLARKVKNDKILGIMHFTHWA
jgi:hypothetical protein